MQTSASIASRSSGASPPSSCRSASWSQRERTAATEATLTTAEMVCPGHRGDDLCLVCRPAREWAQGRKLLHHHVAVALVALESAAREEERLAANKRPEAFVHGRRHDEVDLAVFVFEEHEDDPVRRRRALAGDDESGDRDRASILEVLDVEARHHLGGEMRPQKLERVHTYGQVR